MNNDSTGSSGPVALGCLHCLSTLIHSLLLPNFASLILWQMFSFSKALLLYKWCTNTKHVFQKHANFHLRVWFLGNWTHNAFTVSECQTLLFYFYKYIQCKSTNICIQSSLFHCLLSKNQKIISDIKRAPVIVSRTIQITYIYFYVMS